MKASVAYGWLVLSLPLVVGCGGKEKGPATPAAVVTTSPKVEAVDLSPVSAPASLTLWGRATDVEGLMSTGLGYAGLPSPGVATLLMGAGDLAALSSLVDFSQPVDTAVFLKPGRTPKPEALVSVALRSLGEARERLQKQKVKELAGGALYTIGDAPKADAADDDDDDFDVGETGEVYQCWVGPAVGTTANVAGAPRAVCGKGKWFDDSAAAQAQLGFVTRTLPTLASPSRLYFDLSLRPLRGPARELSKLSRGLAFSLDMPELAGLFDLATSAAEDVAQAVSDAERVVLLADLDERGLRTRLQFQFASQESTTAKLMLSHPERAEAPPASLQLAPSGFGVAGFHHGVDLKPLDPALERLRATLTDIAKQQAFPEADRKRIDAWLWSVKDLIQLEATTFTGFDAAAVDAAATALESAKRGKSAEAERKATFALQDALEGWQVTYTSASPEELVRLSKDAAAVVNSASLKKWLQKQLSELLKGSKALDLLQAKVKVRSAPANFQLPKGTQLIETTTVRTESRAGRIAEPGGGPSAKAKPAKPAKPATLTEYTFVTPSGSGSLVGRGASAALAAQKLNEALAKSGAKSEALSALLAARANGGGYVTPGAIAAAGAKSSPQTRSLRLLRAAAGEGGFVFWRALPADGQAKAGSLELEISVPKKSIVGLVPFVRQF